MSYEESKKLTIEARLKVIFLLLDTLHLFIDKTNIRIDKLEELKDD